MMRKFSCFLLLIGVALASEGFAEESCRVVTPSDYTVFSARDINYFSSDIQGIVGAGRDINLSNFLAQNSDSQFCATVIAGRNFSLTSGSIQGGGVLVGEGFAIDHGSVEGEIRYGYSHDELRALNDTALYFRNQALNFAELMENNHVSIDSIALALPLNFQGNPGINVFELRSDQLERIHELHIQGDASSLFVFNIWGSDVSIRKKNITLEGAIRPEQVFFNFPEAIRLTLSESGSEAYGIPATILAPFAQTTLTDIRITGGVYVGDLAGNGQVDYVKPRWPELEPPCSGKCQK